MFPTYVSWGKKEVMKERDELFNRPRKPHEATDTNNSEALKEIGTETIEQHFTSVIKKIDCIVSILDGFLEKSKAIVEEHDEQ